MAATGLPTDGTGTITVSGVSGTVTRAILVWHGPTSSASNMVNATVTFKGNSITGTYVGTSDANCWSGFTNSRAYYADVSSLVCGNGERLLEIDRLHVDFPIARGMMGALRREPRKPVSAIDGVSLHLDRG